MRPRYAMRSRAACAHLTQWYQINSITIKPTSAAALSARRQAGGRSGRQCRHFRVGHGIDARLGDCKAMP